MGWKTLVGPGNPRHLQSHPLLRQGLSKRAGPRVPASGLRGRVHPQREGLVEGFEIKGVSEEIRQRFSKRRAEVEAAIEQFIAERGRQPKADEIAELARATRG